jgi:hypothetical protein
MSQSHIPRHRIDVRDIIRRLDNQIFSSLFSIRNLLKDLIIIRDGKTRETKHVVYSCHIIVGFLALLNSGGEFAGFIVGEEKSCTLENEMLTVFGLPFEGLMHVCQADVQIYHGISGIESKGAEEVVCLESICVISVTSVELTQGVEEAPAGVENVSVQHQQRNVQIIVDDQFTLLINSRVRAFVNEVQLLALFIHKRKVHCFDLAEHVLLTRTRAVPVDWGVNHPCYCREHSIRVGGELVVFHEEPSYVDASLFIAQEKSTGWLMISRNSWQGIS